MASDMRKCAGGNFQPVPTQPYDATAGSRQICPCFVLLLTRFFPKQLERPSATTPRHSHEGKLTELETQPHRRDSPPLAALAESPPPLSPSKEQAHSNKFWMHHGHSWSPSKERSPFQQLWAPVPANAAAGCSKKTPWSPWSPWAPSKERIAPAILDAGSSNRRSKSTHPRSGSSKSRCWFQQISTPVPTLTQHNLYPPCSTTAGLLYLMSKLVPANVSPVEAFFFRPQLPFNPPTVPLAAPSAHGCRAPFAADVDGPRADAAGSGSGAHASRFTTGAQPRQAEGGWASTTPVMRAFSFSPVEEKWMTTSAHEEISLVRCKRLEVEISGAWDHGHVDVRVTWASHARESETRPAQRSAGAPISNVSHFVNIWIQ